MTPDELALFSMGEGPVFPVPRPSCIVDPLLAIDAAAEGRFWARVVKSSSCWWWTGAISTDGYGRITWRRKNRQRSLSAHRFALLLVDPDLAAEAIAEHWCNSPLCVRVAADHVQTGTQASNVAWAVATGRHRGRRPVQDSSERHALSVAIRAWLLDGGDPEDVPGRPRGLGDEPMLF